MNLLRAFALVLVALQSLVAAPAPTYTITRLGTSDAQASVATGINAAGQACGHSVDGASIEHAWRYTPGAGVVELGSFGGPVNRAQSINNAGLVTGHSTDPNGLAHGFISNGGALTDIGSLGLQSGMFPRHINASGMVVGFSQNPDEGEIAFRVTPPGAIQPLGTVTNAALTATAAAYAVNDAGRVVGIGTGASGFQRAFRSTATGALEELGTLGGDESWAYAINNAGQIVGSATFTSTDTHAFFFSDAAGMVDLGTLGGYTSTAFALDSAGTAVGTAENPGRDPRAVLWPSAGGGTRDLNDFIPVNAGWVLTEAVGVNDAGQIVGNGLLHGQPSAFLLTPNSAPDTTPPVAILSANAITNLYSGSEFLRITFWDDNAVQASSITTNCIRVTGPNGFNETARFYPYSAVPPYQLMPTNDAMAVAVYFYIVPTNNLWSGALNGVYTVAVEPDTVRDTSGNVMPDGVIGTFTVSTETRPTLGLTTASSPVMNLPATYTLAALSSFPQDTGDVFTFHLDWNGDGSEVQKVTGTNGTEVAHTFPSIGVHTIRATATDVHGATSADAFLSVLVGNPPFPNAWVPAPSLTGNRRLAVGLNANGTLVCLGGQPFKSSKLQAQLLAPGAGAFADGARIADQTLGLGAGIDVLGRIVFFGGIEANAGADNSSGFVYLPASGRGPAIASKHIAAHDIAFCSDSQHRLYSMGGTSAGAVTDGVERYDAIANTWTIIASMPARRTQATATADGRGHILVIGGFDPDASGPSSTVFSYDIATDTWSQRGNAPVSTFGPTLGRVAQLGADGLVYPIGGLSSAHAASAEVYVLDPAQDQWFAGPRLLVGRGTPAVALGDDGFIYAMGGDETTGGGGGGGGSNGQATVERLDTRNTHAPRIVSNPPFTTVQARAGFGYQIVATGNPRPTYALATAPDGMTIDAVNGLVQWVPGTNQVGVQSVVVRATSNAGSAEQTFPIAVTPIPGDVTPPTAPATISIVFRSATGVTLTWPPATDDVGVASYNIYGLFRGSRSSHIGLMASGITNRSYITHGTASAYYVAAVDATGNISPRSIPVSNGVLTLPVISGPTTPPTIIQGTAFLTTINCSANPSAGFSQLIGPSGMTFTHVAGPMTNADYVVVQWQPTAAQLGTNTFKAFATNANTTGSSATFSVVVLPNGTDFIPPTPVAQIFASGISFDRCHLSWTPAGDNLGVANYHIVATHFGATSNHVVTLDIPGTSTETVLTGLLESSGYTVVITPSDAARNVGGSTSLFFTTLPNDTVTLHIAAGPATGTLAFDWNAAGTGSKFTIESSESLDAPNWAPVDSNAPWPIAGTNAVVTPTPTARFFRVLVSP